MSEKKESPDTAPIHPNPDTLTLERGGAPTLSLAGHFQNGKLTRAGMEQVIANGGSVMYGGRVISDVRFLPDEADLAAGDETATQAALDGLAAQREALDRQEQKLLANRGAAQKARKAGATGGGAGADEDLDSLTVPELRDRAQALGVESTSTLHKDELVKEIKKAQKKAGQQ